MRVLGVDPGLSRTGVAVVDGRAGALRLVHASCLTTSAEAPDSERLLMLSRLVAGFVAEHRPHVAAVERLFFSTNRLTAMRVSEARGVLLCAVAGAGVPVVEYAPNEVKEAVAGYGAARKPQVVRMTCRVLQVERFHGPDDVADACAVAVCHHHRAALSGRLRRQPGARARGLRLDQAIARARDHQSVTAR